MLIMIAYVCLFLAQGWMMGSLLKDNWDTDDRPWFRCFIVAVAVLFYTFLSWVIWTFVNDPVVKF